MLPERAYRGTSLIRNCSPPGRRVSREAIDPLGFVGLYQAESVASLMSRTLHGRLGAI